MPGSDETALGNWRRGRKVTFDLPDSLKCVFLNYVYENEKGFLMEVISVATDGLYDGSIIERRTKREADYDT